MSGLQATRTKKLITLAFIKLMQEESFDRLSVTALAKEALINRQTFYNYYLDKYDLVDQLNQQVESQVKQVIDQRISLKNQHVSLSILYDSDMLKDVFGQRKLILALLTINDIPASLRSRINRQIRQMVSQIDPQANEFELTVYSNLFVTTLEHLLKQGQPPTREQFEQLKASILKMVQ